MGGAEREIHELFSAPLKDFVARRDELAKRLRADGDREAAAAVAALRKPTQSAWLANQVARCEPKLLKKLLRAGSALREAQSRTLAGEGAELLRDAAAREREAVEEIVAAARGFLPAGRLASESVLGELRDTLYAAARDEDVRRALSASRLERAARAASWPG